LEFNLPAVKEGRAGGVAWGSPGHNHNAAPGNRPPIKPTKSPRTKHNQ